MFWQQDILTQNGTPKIMQIDTPIPTATGTNTYAVTLNPAWTTPITNQLIYVKFTNANTGTSTLDADGTARPLRKYGAVELVANDIKAGQILAITWDGTQFQVITLSATAGTSGGGGEMYVLGYDSTSITRNATFLCGLYATLGALTLFNQRPSRQAIAMKTGNITQVVVMCTVAGVLASDIGITLQVYNVTTDTTSTITATYKMNSLSLYQVSRIDYYTLASPLPVTAGDLFQVRIVTPNFITEPTQVSQIFQIKIE
jgi:hypothetical protein